MKKRFIIISAMAVMVCGSATAEQNANREAAEIVDSLKMYELQEVQVQGVRATKKTPIAFTNVDKEAIKEMNHGKDLPMILSYTPGVTVTSDAGNGIGYTSIYVRGNDNTRVNVTANGIPINDAESSGVFWTNMPDFASSAESIQIQRGAGTSTNGAGAFGASVNILTEKIGAKPFVGIDLGAGSYYSHKETLRFGTGLINGHWGIQGRLSNIGSKGYLQRASSKLDSYFIQGGYFGEKTAVKFITFNGQEETYHAWNYTSRYEQSLFGRDFNSCGAMNYVDKDGNDLGKADFTYGSDDIAEVIANGGHVNYYKDQKDFYHQQHYQLLMDQIINDNLTLNVGLHYTRGDGYYESYKAKKKAYEYGLAASSDKTDLINQKKMANDFFGAIASLNYDNKNGLTAVLGGGWNRYIGDHFGYITWVKNPSIITAQSYAPFMPYYDNCTRKNDGNIYGKVNWEFMKGLSAYVDLQYRHIGLTMRGPADEFSKKLVQTYFNENHKYDFFNPKFGINYQISDNHRVYASVAMSHKEPTRNDFEANIGKGLKAEKLVDWEAGYRFAMPKFAAGVNFYYMNYTDQFVLTGMLDAQGEPIKTNSGKSYRAGIEMDAAWMPADWFCWSANATVSRNRNKNWTVQECNPDYVYGETLDLGSTPISFSPSFLFNNILTFKYKGFKAMVLSQYIGERYLTNTGFKSYEYAYGSGETVSMMLDGYFKTDIDLSYTTKALNKYGMKDFTIGVTLYNIFNKKYDNNGWAYCEVEKKADGTIRAWSDAVTEVGVAPSAPFNFMVNMSMNF